MKNTYILIFLLIFLFLNQTYAEQYVVTVSAAQESSEIPVGGSVVPYKTVVLAAQVNGVVEYIAGEEGDQFKSGTLLAKINDDALQARRATLMATLQQAQAVLNNAQVQYNREIINPQVDNITTMPGFGVPSLFDQFVTRQATAIMGITSPSVERYSDLYNRGAEVQKAYANWLQARASLGEVEANIADASALAPFSGVLIQKSVEVGDSVVMGQPLLQYANILYLRIEANIPTYLVKNLEKGMFISAHIKDTDTMVKARVSQIFPVADIKSHTIRVKFDLPKGVPASAGMYAEVILPVTTQQSTLPSIPKSAIIKQGSLPAVYLVNENDELELRMIRIGKELSDDQVTVLAGLKVGQRILAKPYVRIPSADDKDNNKKH